jgi:hypothetical protein
MMLTGIKNWFFYNAFKRTVRPKNQDNLGINPLHSICILFDGTSESDLNSVKKINKLFGVGNRSIQFLAFINTKDPIDNMDFPAYNLKNVNWYGLPSGEKVSEFIQCKGDILMVLCKSMLPHFEYIIENSECKFVIGPSLQKAEKYFDVMVEISEEDQTEHLINKVLTAIDKIAIKL